MYFETNKLKTLFTYGGPLLIFFGVVRLHLYYQAFDLEIENFLEFTEILTAFFGDLIFLAITILIAIFLDFFGTTDSWVEANSKFVQSFDKEESFLRRTYLSTKRLLPFFLPMNAVNLGFLFYLLFKHQNINQISWLLFWTNLTVVIVIFQFEMRRKYFKLYGTNINPTISNLILLLFVSVAFLLQSVQTEIANVKYHKKYINVSFSIDGNNMKSDSLHYYIGNTRSYLFYYNQDSSKTVVYPMSRIASITYKK